MTRQALDRSARPLICLKHGRSLTRPGGPFISASGKMTVEFFWILLTTVGALLRSDPTAGKGSTSAGQVPPGFRHASTSSSNERRIDRCSYRRARKFSWARKRISGYAREYLLRAQRIARVGKTRDDVVVRSSVV